MCPIRPIVSLDITNNRLVPNAMEPRAAIAEYDEAEEHFTLYTTSQNPHVARLVLSAFYNIAQEHKLRVVAPDVGGDGRRECRAGGFDRVPGAARRRPYSSACFSRPD